mgnify:CR=1 FL=1
MSYPYIIQGNNIVVVIDNIPYSVNDTHMAFKEVREAIRIGDWETVKKMVNVRKAIADYSHGNVSVYGETLFWKQEEMHGSIVKRFIDMCKEGFSVAPLVAFMDNLMLNPSTIAISELYDFLEKGQLPITPDGCFLAYKRITADYKDCHSNTVVNKPAAKLTKAELDAIAENKLVAGDVTVTVVNGSTFVKMDRTKVNSNKYETCSTGLHFCSLSYLQSFGGDRTIIVKINPKNVVSIPADYSSTKGRCSEYEIIGEIPNDHSAHMAAFSSNVQTNANNVIPESSVKIETGWSTSDYVDPEYDNENENNDEEQEFSEQIDYATTKPKKALSMTPNAIRKRERRAAAKLAKK